MSWFDDYLVSGGSNSDTPTGDSYDGSRKRSKNHRPKGQRGKRSRRYRDCLAQKEAVLAAYQRGEVNGPKDVLAVAESAKRQTPQRPQRPAPQHFARFRW